MPGQLPSPKRISIVPFLVGAVSFLSIAFSCLITFAQAKLEVGDLLEGDGGIYLTIIEINDDDIVRMEYSSDGLKMSKSMPLWMARGMKHVKGSPGSVNESKMEDDTAGTWPSIARPSRMQELLDEKLPSDTKFMPGDKVRFGLQNDRQGTVTRILEEGTVEIEYSGAKGETKTSVQPAMVVTLVKSNAQQDPPPEPVVREWKDDSGKFSIRGSISERDEKTIRIRKEDGRVVDVPVERLSQRDREYLKSLDAGEDPDNPFAGGEMEGTFRESVAAGDSDRMIDPGKISQLNTANGKRVIFHDVGFSVTPDPAERPSVPQLQHGIPLKAFDFAKPAYNKLSTACTSRQDSTVVLAASNMYDRDQVMLQLVELPSGETNLFRIRADSVRTTAISPDGRLVAVVTTVKFNDYLLLFEWKERQLSLLTTWEYPGLRTMDFIDDDRLIAQSNNSGTKVFDVRSGNVLASIQTSSSVPFGLSANKRLFAVHQNDRIYVVDIEKLAVAGSLSFKGERSRISFSPDGNSMATLTEDGVIVIWNINSASIESESHIQGTYPNSGMTWIDDRYLLVSGRVFDTRLRTIVWRYEGGRINKTRAGNFWYIVGETSENGPVLLPVEMPDPTLSPLTESLSASDLEVLKPGMAISLDLRLPFSDRVNEHVESTIRARLEEIGLRVDASSDIVLHANSLHGDTRTATGGGLLFPGSGGNSMGTVEYTPVTTSMWLEQNGRKLWTIQKLYTLPGTSIDPGDKLSFEEIVAEACKPKPDFFENATIPHFINRLPDDMEVLGTTRLTSDGVR